MGQIWSGIAALGMAACAASALAASKPKPRKPPPPPPCCQVLANTPVVIELTEPISTKVQKSGDAFAFRLAAPLVVDGKILLKAGTPGTGEIIQITQPGLGGKAAKLVAAVRYLTVGDRQAPLKGLQLASVGRNNSDVSNAVGVGGMVFAPLGVAAFAVKGGSIVLPVGTKATAKLAQAMVLPPLGPAPPGTPSARPIEPPQGPIALPRPPPGQGLVVFFRPKSLMGTGQWFNVREKGSALGKLTNGAWFAVPAAPGIHAYTAKTEPEFDDSLRLNIDPGETYFVEGVLTKGVVLGVAGLSPSDRGAFDKAAKELQAATPADKG